VRLDTGAENEVEEVPGPEIDDEDIDDEEERGDDRSAA